MPSRRWLLMAWLVGLSVMVIVGVSVSRVRSQPAPPATLAGGHGDHGTPAGWKFTWPTGDPAKGREVFVKLECYSCHEVRGERFPTPSEPAKVGPELSAMGPLHEPEYFAEAIINPNAVIERGKGFEASDGSSKMPSYNDAVTVQEVIDLVAFLRALKPPSGAGGQGGHDQHH
jgi:mono/diheme cytochrome c family protein